MPAFTPASLDGMPEVEGVEHRLVDVDSPTGRLKVHLAEGGTDGDPVLLVHGWPQHWWTWRDVVPLLGDDHRLLMPDLRGFGWSEAPGTGYDAETFASDLVGLLDALGIERVHVIGHDWGGFTTFVLALRHPDRIRGAVVCSAPHVWMRLSLKTARQFWKTWYVGMVATPLVGRRLVARPRFVPWFIRLGGRTHVFSDAAAETFGARLREPARAAASVALYRHYLRLVNTIFLRHEYERLRLTVPLRLLFGRKDFYVPLGYLDRYEPHTDDMTVELIDGVGHWVPEERPALVAQRARELFSRT